MWLNRHLAFVDGLASLFLALIPNWVTRIVARAGARDPVSLMRPPRRAASATRKRYKRAWRFVDD